MYKFEKLKLLFKTPISEWQINFSDSYRHIIYPIRLVVQVWKQLVRHRCLQQASSLAFTTVLSLVPLLAVAFFLLNAFDAFQQADSDIIAYIKENFLPEYQAVEISDAIKNFTEKVNISEVGLIAFFPLLLISMLLFNAIETTFNDIWEVKNSRPIFYKFAVFYTIITIGPILMTLSIYRARYLERVLGEGGNWLLNWLFVSLLPFAFMWLAILLGYKLLPNTLVKWRPAITGALIASILIEVTKKGFSYYLSNFVGTGYNMFYGAIAFIPILAVWIYMSWLIVLFGTEFTNVIQNLPKLHIREAMQGSEAKIGNDRIIFINSILAIKLFLLVADNYRRGNAALSKSEIAFQFGIPEEVVERIFKRYKEEHLILEVEGDTEGYIPARSLDEIYIAQLIEAFEGKLERLTSFPKETSKALQILAHQLKSSRQRVINDISVQELLSDSKEFETKMVSGEW